MSSPPRGRTSVSIQARDGILEIILEKDLKAGDQLPSEAELTKILSVSRPTLREAMRLLEQEGLIITQHGVGRFLTATAALKVERPITTYESITQMLNDMGYAPVTRVLGIAEDGGDAAARKALALEAGAQAFVMRRVREADGKPLVYSIETVPRRALPEGVVAADLEGSLNDLLERGGNRPRMSAASVSAAELPKSAPSAIRNKYHGPWLLISEVCFTDEGRPIVFARDYHRGDLFSFTFPRRCAATAEAVAGERTASLPMSLEFNP
jgi:GntR family transcriptional regulator